MCAVAVGGDDGDAGEGDEDDDAGGDGGEHGDGDDLWAVDCGEGEDGEDDQGEGDDPSAGAAGGEACGLKEEVAEEEEGAPRGGAGGWAVDGREANEPDGAGAIVCGADSDHG